MIGRADAHPYREMIHKVPLKIGTLNRFGTIVAIEFTIPHPDCVDVTMYDLAGKEISSLVKKTSNSRLIQVLLGHSCFRARLLCGTNANRCNNKHEDRSDCALNFTKESCLLSYFIVVRTP